MKPTLSCMDKNGLAGAHGTTGGSEKQTVRKVFCRHPEHVGDHMELHTKTLDFKTCVRWQVTCHSFSQSCFFLGIVGNFCGDLIPV